VTYINYFYSESKFSKKVQSRTLDNIF